MLCFNIHSYLNVLEPTTDYGVQTAIRLGGAFTKHLNEEHRHCFEHFELHLMIALNTHFK